MHQNYAPPVPVVCGTQIDEPQEHIKSFSSYGPIGFQSGKNVQIKPEIAAPGEEATNEVN